MAIDEFGTIYLLQASMQQEGGRWVGFRKGISGKPEFLTRDDPVDDAPDGRIGP